MERKEIFLKQVEEVVDFVFQASKTYCDDIVKFLNPTTQDIVYFEVVIYFSFHLDLYMAQLGKIDPDLRTVINLKVDQRVFEYFASYYDSQTEVSKLINSRLSTYTKIINKNKLYKKNYLEEIVFYFEQLLLNAEENNQITSWELGKNAVKLGTMKNYPFLLSIKISEFEGKYILPYYKTMKQILIDENFIPEF